MIFIGNCFVCFSITLCFFLKLFPTKLYFIRAIHYSGFYQPLVKHKTNHPNFPLFSFDITKPKISTSYIDYIKVLIKFITGKIITSTPLVIERYFGVFFQSRKIVKNTDVSVCLYRNIILNTLLAI